MPHILNLHCHHWNTQTLEHVPAKVWWGQLDPEPHPYVFDTFWPHLGSKLCMHVSDLGTKLPKSQVLLPIPTLIVQECERDLHPCQSFNWVYMEFSSPSWCATYALITVGCSMVPFRQHPFIFSDFPTSWLPAHLFWLLKKFFLCFHSPGVILLQNIGSQAESRTFVWSQWRGDLLKVRSSPKIKELHKNHWKRQCELTSSGLLYMTFSILNPLNGWTQCQIIAWLKQFSILRFIPGEVLEI